jgi:Na+/H+ antiporter NhaD/arsenite permease-like protein
MIGFTSKTGVLQFVAVKSVQRCRGNPHKMLLLLALISAAVAAVMDSITAVLLMVPVTLTMARTLGINAVPFLITETVAGNLGGTATLIGSVPNVMTGSAAGLTFNDFLLNAAPAVMIILAFTLLFLSRLYAKEWKAAGKNNASLMSLDAYAYIQDKRLLKKTVLIWVLFLSGCIFHPLMHVEPVYLALAAALILILMCVKRVGWGEVIHFPEWGVLFLILGLFIITGGMSGTGLLQNTAVKVMELTSGNLMFASILLLWVSGLLSAAVDPITYVAVMIPYIKELGAQMNGPLNPLWWSLVLGAGIGSNGTLVGAAANLITAGLANREGQPLSFTVFLKAGIPVTLIGLLIATFYLILMYF